MHDHRRSNIPVERATAITAVRLAQHACDQAKHERQKEQQEEELPPPALNISHASGGRGTASVFAATASESASSLVFSSSARA